MRVSRELRYEQMCEDFRALNTFLWQLPIIMMTLTGGIWYGAANFDLTPPGQSGLLFFAGIVNLLMIGAMVRLRLVMSGIQKNIFALDGRPKTKANFTVVTIFSIILLASSGGSGFVGLNPSLFFNKKATLSETNLDATKRLELKHSELTPSPASESLSSSAPNQAQSK